MAFTLSSTAFAPGAAIPEKHTCDGPDVSPALAWAGAPPNTKAYALIADDPDAPAGIWVHWVLFNVPGKTTGLPQALSKMDTPIEVPGALHGKNDFGRNGYGGPCPPPGKPHRYVFKLYALDTPLALKAGVRKKDVEHAMQGHVLATAQLLGSYGRKR
ncbi:MAG TPA: YbhB/YbcL family Raf kinase inhibitor-like protein [Gemmatimonadales bacterium]|nr:YbhB/YbcL family Raf kinase inhibitor-like protein [Gemmatimonadales bacterium]